MIYLWRRCFAIALNYGTVTVWIDSSRLGLWQPESRRTAVSDINLKNKNDIRTWVVSITFVQHRVVFSMFSMAAKQFWPWRLYLQHPLPVSRAAQKCNLIQFRASSATEGLSLCDPEIRHGIPDHLLIDWFQGKSTGNTIEFPIEY